MSKVYVLLRVRQQKEGTEKEIIKSDQENEV